MGVGRGCVLVWDECMLCEFVGGGVQGKNMVRSLARHDCEIGARYIISRTAESMPTRVRTEVLEVAGSVLAESATVMGWRSLAGVASRGRIL